LYAGHFGEKVLAKTFLAFNASAFFVSIHENIIYLLVQLTRLLLWVHEESLLLNFWSQKAAHLIHIATGRGSYRTILDNLGRDTPLKPVVPVRM